MAEEWGPWIEHVTDQNPCRGKYIHAIDETGHEAEGVSGFVFSDEHWSFSYRCRRVIRYRIRRPKALQQLIDMVENLPVDERIKEDA